ncbi:MAG: type II toxin-antitoxin system VapC family toxin [Chloroflexota bacterium]|nr:type II toxin-antitoxin system VapC family toxin [Chloroflexota bacterium]
MLILDASIAAAWLFSDETEPQAEAVLARLAEDTAYVPQLWHLEVRNVLLVAERRGRIAAEHALELLETLGELPIRTDTTPDLAVAFALARAHGLSFYDALYLELAQRRDGTLATLDSALARSAAAVGLSLSEK